MSRRLTVTGLALAALALTATGCAGSGQVPASQGQVTPAPAGKASTAPVSSSQVSGTPSLPPGDPGPDAPSVADPGPAADVAEPGGARRNIPRDALLGPAEAAQMLGGRWSAAAATGDRCTAIPAVAGRTVALADGRSMVVETVSTHRGPAAADAAVAALLLRLPDCGWDVGPDPRLGSSSLSATRGGETLAVVAAEGVTVVLAGSGPATTGFGWSGLLDLALGTSCAAAREGCH